MDSRGGGRAPELQVLGVLPDGGAEGVPSALAVGRLSQLLAPVLPLLAAGRPGLPGGWVSWEDREEAPGGALTAEEGGCLVRQAGVTGRSQRQLCLLGDCKQLRGDEQNPRHK